MRRILFTVGTVAATLAISGCAAGVYRTNPTAESSTDPGGDRIVVTGNGVQRSIDCTGRDADVDGNALQVVLNGTCPTVRAARPDSSRCRSHPTFATSRPARSFKRPPGSDYIRASCGVHSTARARLTFS